MLLMRNKWMDGLWPVDSVVTGLVHRCTCSWYLRSYDRRRREVRTVCGRWLCLTADCKDQSSHIDLWNHNTHAPTQLYCIFSCSCISNRLQEHINVRFTGHLLRSERMDPFVFFAITF